MKKHTSKLRLSGAYAISIFQSVLGGFLLLSFGIALIVMLFSFSGVGAGIIISAIMDVIGVLLLGRGSKNRGALNMVGKIELMLDKAERIKIEHAALNTGYSMSKVTSYVSHIIKKGYMENIYLTKEEIVYSEGIFIEDEPKVIPESVKHEEKTSYEEQEEDVYKKHLKELEMLDWKITDEKMAKYVHEIFTISRSIYQHAADDPEKMNKLRRFTNYYLPTTIKLLKTYEEMGKQTPKGENIRESMKNIEEIAGSVVDTFRREHDNLYKDVALDISSDIEVLKMMMDTGIKN